MYLPSDLVSPVCMYFAGQGCGEAGAFDVYAPAKPKLFHYKRRKEFMNEEDAKDSFRKPASSVQ